MNRKILNWHKENMDKCSFKVEEYFAKTEVADERNLILYGILKALVMAVGFILTEMEKNIGKERHRDR